MIDGVKFKKLNRISDQRGYLQELIRPDYPEFIKFGQCYLTHVRPGVVKGFHCHHIQIDNFICVAGNAMVTLYDERPDSPTYKHVEEYVFGEENPYLLQIPVLVQHGFMSASSSLPASIVNLPTEMYNYTNPDEYRKPFDFLKNEEVIIKGKKVIGYDWYSSNG